MTNDSRGANVINAVNIFTALDNELTALKSYLETALTKVPPNAPVAFDIGQASEKGDAYATNGGWLCNGTRWIYPATKVEASRLRRNPLA